MASDILEISNILNRVLATHGISEAELSRKIGIPRATINRLVSGRTPDPRASTLKAIADHFNISVDQLIGKQPLFCDSNQNVITETSMSLPIIDWKEARNWNKTIKQLKADNHFDWVISEPSVKKGVFALRVQGESMSPQFQENTILIIEPTEQVKNRDFVITHIKESNEIVFRQLIQEGNYKFLKAINPMFPVIQMDVGDKVIGVIVQTRKKYE